MKTITISAREYFDRANGNSSFSARIYIDNEHIAILRFQCGYGDQYIQEAAKKLNELGLIKLKRYSTGGLSPLWRYCRENNIKLLTDKATVTKKEALNFVS